MSTYGYVRVSTIEQAQGTSLAEQERRIQGMALFHGVEIECMFRDAGVSGSIDLQQRPDGGNLIAALQPGDTVIVAKLDRAFRDAADALNRVKSWKEQGIKLILADMGADPVTENGASKLFFGILACFAEWERERILERTIDGRAAKKKAGGHIGGSTPFGYQKIGEGKEAKLIPDPKQQSAIRTIEAASAEGMSLRKISERVARLHGLKVSYQTISRILTQAA